jgi:hypothetical protein
MPALIHNSQNFASRGIAILDQSYEEQPSGLVRVRVDYAMTNAAAGATLNQLFFHDAPPPVYPSIYPRQNLQRSSLFLESHSVEKSFGQWRVTASYVGARILRAKFRGFITRESEARITPPFRGSIGSFPFSLRARFVAQIIKTTVAGTNEAIFDIEETSQNFIDIKSMVSRLTYGPFNIALEDAFSRGAVLQFAQFVASPQEIFRSFEPAVQTSTSIDNVTSSVIVATTTREIVFQRGGG